MVPKIPVHSHSPLVTSTPSVVQLIQPQVLQVCQLDFILCLWFCVKFSKHFCNFVIFMYFNIIIGLFYCLLCHSNFP